MMTVLIYLKQKVAKKGLLQTINSQWLFLLNMFPAPKIIAERLIEFKVAKGMEHDLRKLGLTIGPGESIQSEGVQSQGAFWAVADKGVVQVKVREIIKD